MSTGEETGCWTDATDGQLAGLPTIASGWKWKVEIKGNIGNSSAVYTLPIFTESGNEKKCCFNHGHRCQRMEVES